MDLREETQISSHDDEMRHWWIQTRFLYLDREVRASLRRQAPPRRISIIEMGCGTGQNIRHLRETPELSSRIARIIGVDPMWDPMRPRPYWLNDSDRIVNSLDDVDPALSFNLLVAMDVLEHIDDDAAALCDWLRRLAPTGSVFLTVPANMRLWSYHDENLRHKRRYSLTSLCSVANSAGLAKRHLHYAFGFLFIPAYLLRNLSRKNKKRDTGTDLRLHSPIVNSMMTVVGRIEAAFSGNRYLGTSVVGVFDKSAGGA